MAVGEKYSSLTAWLNNCGQNSVRLSFEELNEIIPIPKHAYKDRSSWANLSKPASFCSSWINAGYFVSAISLPYEWVVFSKGQSKSNTPKSFDLDWSADDKAIGVAIECGYKCYDEMLSYPNHRYKSWEYCHEVFKRNRKNHDDATIDLLCLHLAWYLASWGMLRNSFLMQKDYKIHAKVVMLLFQPEWESLWDITPEKMAQQWYAERMLKLFEKITETYIETGGGIPTETLISKILLGTVGCLPAYDRYFKKALSATRAATQQLSVKSIMALGTMYQKHCVEFEALRQHCSASGIEYPAAKVIDMCFFEYGLQLEGGRDTEVRSIDRIIPQSQQ